MEISGEIVESTDRLRIPIRPQSFQNRDGTTARPEIGKPALSIMHAPKPKGHEKDIHCNHLKK